MDKNCKKCFLEFQDCAKDYDCISCNVSKDYWKSVDIDVKHKTKNVYNSEEKVPHV